MNKNDLEHELPPLTPLQEAQDLIYQAWEAPTKRERKKGNVVITIDHSDTTS
jgi:hypothetical protein